MAAKYNSGIYEIRNLVNNKFYIGSSSNFTNRFQKHRWYLNHDQHANQYLQNAWNKYGSESFEFKILLICDSKDLLLYEQLCIDNLKPEYNLAPKAGNNLGFRRLTKDRAGDKYNRVTLIERRPRQGTLDMWLGLCECGTLKEFSIARLKKNQTKSCGCLRRQVSAYNGKTYKRRKHNGTLSL